MQIQIKVNKATPRAGIGIHDVEADAQGVPLDLFWRRRLKDAVTDDCCEVIQNEEEEE